MFVVIEGVDSSGKATQSKLLAERLRGRLFSFPRYNTVIGKMILRHLKGETALRSDDAIAPEDPLAFQCLMVADKALAAPDIIQAAATCTAVCDRWIPSAICYGAADGVDMMLLAMMHEFLPQADLNIFLDVTPEEALRRRPEVRDRYERDRAKQEVVRQNYLKMWAIGGDKYVIVDGDGGGSDQAAIDVVADRVWSAVMKAANSWRQK